MNVSESFSGLFARVVAVIGGAALLARRQAGGTPAPAWGSTPAIPTAKSQGSIPTLKMPTAQGWSEGQVPACAPGLKVNAFATDLAHPRWMLVLPNGDVLVAEATFVAGAPRSIFDYAMVSTMKRAAAMGVSANRITLLRDADGDGVAEIREVFLEGLNQPFGMALLGDTFYVGNTDGVVAFPYIRVRRASPRQGASSWISNPAAIGRAACCRARMARNSLSASARSAILAMKAWMWRRAERPSTSSIWSPARAASLPAGLRNPVGLAWEPQTGALWTVVNERDGLGDETPPDYLTSVRDGGFYGWPYCYWGQTVDDRVPQDPAAVATAITPDYALGGHTASLGLCWLPAGTLPGFPDGMAIGQHGSWNRSTLSGYKVVFVPFVNGAPAGPPRDILSGFLAPDERVSYGRPVGVTIGPDGCGAGGGRCGRRDLAGNGSVIHVP